ncbi:MAG: hypothetical protein LBS29_04545 [Endomicrobium sp.]|jgi:hypothetical protein|nr:hypothetical protein [Endomicrobium sp.]
MLLDVDNYYGEHEGRLMPIITFLGIAATPLLLWVYFNFIVAWYIFMPIYCVFVVRVSLLTIGREKERMRHFKNQLYDEFSSVHSLLGLRTIHKDGLIEYVNGTVAYAVVAYNGTVLDELRHAQQLKEFISLLVADYDVDILVQNITETKALDNRYKGVKLFVDEKAAKDFIEIIDHNRQIIYSSSLLLKIIFVIKSRKLDWKDLKANANIAIYSNASKIFKDVHLADKDEVVEIVGRDINSFFDLDEMLQRKYSTHEYYGSKVLHYGEREEKVVVPEFNESTIGFMKVLDE